MKALVVEDDPAVRDAVVQALQQDGFDTDKTDNGSDGQWMAEHGSYDIVLLDIMLPEQDGLAITRHLRAAEKDTPVILMTARDAVTDRVRGLDVGADDYIVKPFALSEMMARVRAVLRRHGHGGPTDTITYGAIRIEPKTRNAWFNEQSMTLTTKEYDLLEFFVTNPERILTREQIFDRVWGLDSEAGDTVVDVYVHYLRRKLASAGCNDHIVTQRGVGFMLKEQ